MHACTVIGTGPKNLGKGPKNSNCLSFLAILGIILKKKPVHPRVRNRQDSIELEHFAGKLAKSREETRAKGGQQIHILSTGPLGPPYLSKPRARLVPEFVEGSCPGEAGGRDCG
jgi:hypothetical protein